MIYILKIVKLYELKCVCISVSKGGIYAFFLLQYKNWLKIWIKNFIKE